MITMNLSRAFFILMCSYALFSTFRGSFRADCIEQFNFWKGISQVPPCRVFSRLLLRVTEKMQETGVSVFRPYPGQDYQTICRCHSQVAAHSPQMFLDWVLFWSRAWALDLRRSTTWTNQAAVFESLLTFSSAFYPLTAIDTPDTIDTWGAVTCHKPQNPLLTKSENRMLMAYVWKTHLS